MLRDYINVYCRRNMYKQGPKHAGDNRKIGQLVEITFGITIISQRFLHFKVPLLLRVGTTEVIFRMALFLFLTPITYSYDVFHTHTHNLGVIVARLGLAPFG